MRALAWAIVAIGALAPGSALAHTGAASGFLHPLTGLDHVLAMISVGLLAAQTGGRALWLVPVSFMAAMAVGGGLGMTGLPLPAVEPAIAFSVILLGALIASGVALPAGSAMALAGVFALFHGHAHGAAMPQTLSPLVYALGFVAATGLLHLSGLALHAGLMRRSAALARPALRMLGGAIALGGTALLSAAG